MKPALETIGKRRDNGELVWPQGVTDREQMPLLRLAGDEDEFLMLFNQLPHDVNTRFHEFHRAAASENFVAHRIAMAHSPHRLGAMQQNRSFRISQQSLLNERARVPVTSCIRPALENPQRLFDGIPAALP